MTAETDIAAIDDGGANTAAEVRTALTSVLDRSQPYSIVLIPDTQQLSNSDTRIAHFQAAADWIVANEDTHKIGLVLHLGDVVQDGITADYDRVQGPMETIFDSGIPFVATIGNHDYDGAVSGSFTDHDDTTLWNTYFGPSQYTGRDWWDGAFKDSGRSENMYLKLTLGGRPTLVLALETFPRPATMTWAEGIIGDNPLYDVIIITHSFLYRDGTRVEDGTEHGPDHYSTAVAGTSGADIWTNHLKQYHNVVAVFSGHHINGDFTAERTDHGDDGNLVYQQFTNWQLEGEGGDGRVVLMSVNPPAYSAFRQVYNAMDDAFEPTYELRTPYFADLDAYALTDGSRPFTGTVAGVTPTSGPHLATKAYVDAAGGGGSGVLTQIDSTLLASNAASITFSAIPNTFTSLIIKGRMRTDRAGLNGDHVAIQVGNGSVDSGTNYNWFASIIDVGGSHSVDRGSGDTQWDKCGWVAAGLADSGFFGLVEWRFDNYADTSQFRHVYAHGGWVASSSSHYNFQVGGNWENTTDEIDIITFAPLIGSNFLTGTQLSLYGVL